MSELELLKEFGLRHALRRLRDRVLLAAIRACYPGGVIVGVHFKGGIYLASTTKPVLIQNNVFTGSDYGVAVSL